MKNVHFKQFTVFAIVLLFFLTSAVAQQTIELKYNLNEGTQYKSIVTTNQAVTLETNGMEMSVDMSMIFDLNQKVMAATADSIKFENQIKKIKMSQSMLGIDVEYDSSKPLDEQGMLVATMGEEFQKIINKSFFTILDKKGNLGEVKVENTAENNKIAESSSSGYQFVVFPEGKISIGDEWEADIQQNSDQELVLHATYTLLKIAGNNATIGMNGALYSNSNEFNIDGSITGEIIVDIKTGWSFESNLSQNIKMEIDQNGEKVPANTKGTIKITSVKL